MVGSIYQINQIKYTSLELLPRFSLIHVLLDAAAHFGHGELIRPKSARRF
jgi:hypothetical protein